MDKPKKEKITIMKTKGKDFLNPFDIYFETYCNLCKEDLEGEGSYLRDKFQQMQANFISWIAGLSGNNRERLANNITKGE